MIGTTIGKYRFVSRLGRGGMGTVYKAVDETLDREVAIKVLNPEISDAKLMARFRAEATTLARLNHPQIATIYEIYVSDADLLMVMELVRGETLDQLSARVGPLPPEQAAILVAQVLGALGHAHRAGIVHRDLKPANVMITEAGAVKIMDFGIARVLGAEHLTSDGTMMGTPAYMAPEQVLGKDIDARADLYAAGVVFYRLLTGCLPFQADTPIGIVQKQLWDAPTPARSYRADLPDWCETILERALAKAPADRFQTADEFRSALLSASGHSSRGLTTQFGGDTLAAFQAATLTPPPAAPLTPVHELTPTQLAQAPTVTLQQPTPADSSRADAVPAPALPVAAVASPRSDVPPSSSRRLAAVAATAVAALAAVAVVAVTLFDGGSEPSSATTASLASLGGGGTPPPAETTPSAPVAAVTEPAATLEQSTGSLPSGSTAPAAGTSIPAPGTAGAAPASKRAATSAVAPARRVTATEAEKAPVATEPEPAPTPEPEPAAPDPAIAAAAAMPPVIFSAQTVVVEAGRNRQRDTIVRIEGGVVTLTGKDQSVVTAVPFTDVVGVSYSNSKQPLWNAPEGPTEITHLDGGTFGFLRGNQHWVSVRTGGKSIVLRLRDQDSRRIVLAFEERLGKKVERVSERRAQ